MAPNSFQNHARYAELVYTQALANRDTDALIRARKYFAQVPRPAPQPTLPPRNQVSNHMYCVNTWSVCVFTHTCVSRLCCPHT